MNARKTVGGKWYPLYTKSRREKVARERLERMGYEVFLPLKKTIWRKNGRRKLVEKPLIPSYVFVKTNDDGLRRAVRAYGVAGAVVFNGRPAEAKEEEIEKLELALKRGMAIEAKTAKINSGEEVEFLSGPFAGYKGRVIRRAGKRKLVVGLECVGKTFLITLEEEDLAAN